MRKINPISGFPEWLPEEKLIEQFIIDRVRKNFELFGFAPIETRAIEPLQWLLKKGETDKEIYGVHRLQAEAGEEAVDWGLHFDLTIPFARYVLQFRNQLRFPMKRYQIQKVWRGERPQEGRYREFYQADIDVIGEKELPLYYDAEMPRLLHQVLAALPLPPVQILFNNRKILEGFYRGLGITAVDQVLRTVDKLDKIGQDAIYVLLTGECGLTEHQAKKCLEISRIRGFGTEVIAAVKGLQVEGELLATGLTELDFVMQSLQDLPPGVVCADLHIARGLDYYTGTVYEGIMPDYPELGAVCSGGRYDNLASVAATKLPGVGVSIGITRILGGLLKQGLLKVSRKTPACVLVALPSEATLHLANATATRLRQRGINCEVFHAAAKYGKQIRYAEKKGIPLVWFPPMEASDNHEVRDIRSGKQIVADPDTWMPAPEDRSVQVILGER